MSRQQDSYLCARAAGATMMTAAVEAGIGIAEARLIENDLARGTLSLPDPGTSVPPPKKEKTMPRGKKAQAPQNEEVQQPDFEKAVRIYRQDIKPAVEAAGERAQEASTGYKAIKKDCRVNTRAARFVFGLEREGEEKRNDVLRSLRGMLNAMNIGITDDLVSRAEGEDSGAPVIPNAPAEQRELVTLN
ncbi:MAG TPA: hypothetical protein VFW19_10715 [Allosphingosinicella sp.]|nr:hypothetical protein [Allosphingosinicella sp.]